MRASGYHPAEYEGDTPLIAIWKQPYKHGGPAKDALGWYTPQEASELLSIPAADIVKRLEDCGSFDTDAYAVEWT